MNCQACGVEITVPDLAELCGDCRAWASRMKGSLEMNDQIPNEEIDKLETFKEVVLRGKIENAEEAQIMGEMAEKIEKLGWDWARR